MPFACLVCATGRSVESHSTCTEMYPNPIRTLPPKEWKTDPLAQIRPQPAPTKASFNDRKPVFTVRTYYVADLVVPLPEPLPLRKLLADQESGTRSPSKAVAPDFETLIDLITKQVEPDSWSAQGGNGEIESFPTNLSLVVSQSAQAHRKIEELLSQLRRERVQVSLETQLVGVTDAAMLTTAESPDKDDSTKHWILSQQFSLAELLQEIRLDPRATTWATPKITLFDKQLANLVISERGKRVVMQLNPAVDEDHSSIALRQRLFAETEIETVSEELPPPVKVGSGQTLVVDVSNTIPRDLLRVESEAEVPVLSRISLVGSLFKTGHANRPVERVYLFITPRIIEAESVGSVGSD